MSRYVSVSFRVCYMHYGQTVHGLCTVDCGGLSSPPNGHVSLNRFTATYNCNDGYSLEGDDSRNCLIDGSWSGSEPNCTVVTSDSVVTIIATGVSVSIVIMSALILFCLCCALYCWKKSSKSSIESMEMVELTDRPRYVMYAWHSLHGDAMNY